MCMRQNRDPEFESGDGEIEDPIGQMREPPGALGAIVRRMKQRAAEQRAAGCADAGGAFDGTAS